MLHLGLLIKEGTSLSARRAWIEIQVHFIPYCSGLVALRKESVDRNLLPVKNRRPFARSLSARRAWIEIRWGMQRPAGGAASLSARRAWIEIVGLTYDGLIASVALRKESVDRNTFCAQGAGSERGRSPQGERG